MPTLYDPLTATYTQKCPSCGYTESWTLLEYIHRTCPSCKYVMSHEEAIRAMAGKVNQDIVHYYPNLAQTMVMEQARRAGSMPLQQQSAPKGREEPSVKTFFIWLGIQCAFARILIGMTLGMWSSLKVSPDYLGYFILPAAIICLAETVTSAIVVYPLVTGQYVKR